MVLYDIYSPCGRGFYTTGVEWSGLVIFSFPPGGQTKQFRLRPFPYVQETT